MLRIICFFLIVFTAQSQDRIPPPPCYANNNTGAGGFIGNGEFLHSRDNNGEVIHFSFSAGQEEASFNDVFVIYLSTGAEGRSVIDNSIDDADDAHRIAITNSNVNGFGSTIQFPDGFKAAYAIAIDVNSSGLYQIPSSGPVGNGGLNFIGSVNSTLASSTQTGFTISLNYADIGITSADGFYLVANYVGIDGYTYDEGYGDGIAQGTTGGDNISFTGSRYIDPAVAGCQSVLSINDIAANSFKVQYHNEQLLINGITGEATIDVFDLASRKLNTVKHQLANKTNVPLVLNNNQLLFVVVEVNGIRKVLKVIPN
ncbi:MAG: hypothetical protein KJO96_04310 [Winogradskyella sp.]|nr:hypothetical protein [Winogradskyella sp.]